MRRQKKDATIHIDFCIELMKMQMAAGRYFIFEHPSSASSWELPRMMRLLKRQWIWSAVSDQCQYDQTGGGELPLKKMTRCKWTRIIALPQGSVRWSTRLLHKCTETRECQWNTGSKCSHLPAEAMPRHTQWHHQTTQKRR